MRRLCQQDFVLGAQRLALGAVADDDRVPAGCDGRQFARGRKAGTAATCQPGKFHLAYQLLAQARGPDS